MWSPALLLTGFQYEHVISHSLKRFGVDVLFSRGENLPQACHGHPCEALWGREQPGTWLSSTSESSGGHICNVSYLFPKQDSTKVG